MTLDLEKRVRDLECITIGVEGTNGLRSRIVTLENDMKEIRKDIRDVTNFQTKVIGALIIISFIAKMILDHVWK